VIGVLANGIAMVLGGIVGITFGSKMDKKIGETLLKVMGVFIIVLGVQSSIQMDNALNILIFLATGTFLGEILKIEYRIESTSRTIEAKFGGKVNNFSSSFTTATLIYCVGSFSIIASIQAGALGDNSILKILGSGFTNSHFYQSLYSI